MSFSRKFERLVRYVSRPPVATARLALTGSGHVRYTLKTPYRDGTTHVIFEPEDFIARLAALVPKPRAHLTRYHGVLTGGFPCLHFRVKGEDSRTQRRRPGAAPPASRRSTCHQHPDCNTPLPIRVNRLLKQRRLILPIRRLPLSQSLH